MVFTHLALSALLLSPSASAPGLAQGAKKPAPANPEAQSQPVDKEYTDSIVKNTTDKMFLTELVDHLPSSDKVPTPAKILGYPMGTPNKLTYTKDQYRYYRELEKATPARQSLHRARKERVGQGAVAGRGRRRDESRESGEIQRYHREAGRPAATNDEEAKRAGRRRQGDLLGLRFDPFARNRQPGDADGAGLSPGGRGDAFHPTDPQERRSS